VAYFIQLVFAGISVGCIYALVALGFTIIFKASGVFNFAQGEFLLVGAFVAYVADFLWHLNFFLAVLVALVITMLIALVFERLVVRRMIGRPIFSIVMITIGLNVLLQTGVVISGGSASSYPAATPFSIVSGFNVGGVHFGASDLWTIAITIVCCAALYVFFRFTRYGLAMRATALDQEAAAATGINIHTVYALAWGIAAAIAVIGGVFLAISSQATFDAGLGNIALLAFPAIILGGLDSIPGAVVGGIIIGLAEELTAGYEGNLGFLGNGFYVIAPFILMIIILLVRPYGLFGTRKVERV
jgi:branched-chain amino acid transport system permease protein